MEKHRIFITRKGWLWNLGGDVRMGVTGSVFVNFWVRSFCNYSSILHPILMILPFMPSFSRLSVFSPHTCSLSLANFFSFSFYISSYPPLWDYHGRTETQVTAHPLLATPDHNLFGWCLGSALNSKFCYPVPSIPISVPGSMS